MFLNNTISQKHTFHNLFFHHHHQPSTLPSKFPTKMESFGILFDEEWESLSRILSDDQDSGHFPGYDDRGLNFDTHSIVSSFMSTHEANQNNSSFINDHGSYYDHATENMNPNLSHYFSQESNNNGCAHYDHGAASLPLLTNGNVSNHESMDLYDENDYHSTLLAQVFSDDSMEELLCSRKEVINVENYTVDPSVPIADKNMNKNTVPSKRKIEILESPNEVEEKVNIEEPNENPKKKTRKNKKKAQPKKKQKVMNATVNNNGDVDGEDTNTNKGGNASIASSSSCSSEDDLTGGAENSNSNWKTRAGRGAATDPQSLYARKRRERINERLKVLQNLVPNGTKVDISTMLEEAVQYVKFLQLQIKLLSSDDMWMFAPIAYNGMDMGLYQKLSQSRN
ncbi:hypothetical protein LXL04_030392 [Taraxacum kok-saghyz]